MNARRDEVPTRVIASIGAFRFLRMLLPRHVEPFRRAIAQDGFQLEVLRPAAVIQPPQLPAESREVLAVVA